MKEQKCWHISYDGTYTSIFYDMSVNSENNYDESFDSFTEAKQSLVKYFEQRVEDNKRALKNAKAVRKTQFELSTKTMTKSQYEEWNGKIYTRRP